MSSTPLVQELGAVHDDQGVPSPVSDEIGADNRLACAGRSGEHSSRMSGRGLFFTHPVGTVRDVTDIVRSYRFVENLFLSRYRYRWRRRDLPAASRLLASSRVEGSAYYVVYRVD